MPEWPEDLQNRPFKPRDVEALTGVNTEQQRLWMKRYGFDFRHVIAPEGGLARWSWTGVQQLMAFGLIFGDVQDHTFALDMIGMGPVRDEALSSLFDLDLRDHPDGDMLILGQFAADLEVAATRYQAVNARRLADSFSWGRATLRPERSYLFNLSSTQRRLASKIGLGDD